MKNNNISYRKTVFDLLKPLLVSFLIYYVTNSLLRAFLEDETDKGAISVFFAVAFYLIYNIAFYIMHVRKSTDDYSLGIAGKKYSFKEDIKEILAGEGKALAIIYGIFAAIFTVCSLVPFLSIVSVLLMPMFPIVYLISIPVVTGIIGWVLVTLFSILVIACSHARIHKLMKQGRI